MRPGWRVCQQVLAAQQLRPLRIPPQRTAPGRCVAREVQIPRKGTWQLAVTVRTSGVDQATVTTPVDIRCGHPHPGRAGGGFSVLPISRTRRCGLRR